eukprot:COSAG02_NODE_1347_length_13138_cov_45.052535_10_plen_92_part_00
MANENRPYLDNPVLVQATGEETDADDVAPSDAIGGQTLGVPPLGWGKKSETVRLKWGRIRGEDINHIKAHANQKRAAKAGLKKRKAASQEK